MPTYDYDETLQRVRDFVAGRNRQREQSQAASTDPPVQATATTIQPPRGVGPVEYYDPRTDGTPAGASSGIGGSYLGQPRGPSASTSGQPGRTVEWAPPTPGEVVFTGPTIMAIQPRGPYAFGAWGEPLNSALRSRQRIAEEEMPDWTLDDGLRLVRALQPETRKFAYHLTLGGGVLNNGRSAKDLDLFFLPMDNGKDKPQPDALLEYLVSLWGKCENLYREYVPPAFPPYELVVGSDGQTIPVHRAHPVAERPTPLVDRVYKHKVKFMRSDGRIDVFIMC